MRKLIEIVNQGTFLLLKADCSLEEILGESFPGDVLRHDFECRMCGRRFALRADTYHGNAGWEPGPAPNNERRVVH